MCLAHGGHSRRRLLDEYESTSIRDAAVRVLEQMRTKKGTGTVSGSQEEIEIVEGKKKKEMKKRITTKPIDIAYQSVKLILEDARRKAYSAVNFAMVQAYWNIGRIIVEEEQRGKAKAGYGEHLLQHLSERLTKDYGKGFDYSNVKNMRQFYLTFPISDALRSQLSWTHYRLLMRVENESAREFYIGECISENWSTRQLERQITSFYYERLLSSRKKDRVRAEIKKLEPSPTPHDVIKDPYVLEFLGLKESGEHLETDLEQALIGKLHDFLLEHGKAVADNIQ